MNTQQARQEIEARYESGLCSFIERDAALEALEYEQGERMNAADIERGFDTWPEA